MSTLLSCGEYVAWVNENGQVHDESGPAVVWNNGEKEYWLYDRHYQYIEWLQKLVEFGFKNKNEIMLEILKYKGE